MENLKNQSQTNSSSMCDMDDMDNFAELCERRLKEEHERIAAENLEISAPTVIPEKKESENEPISESETLDDSEEHKSVDEQSSDDDVASVEALPLVPIVEQEETDENVQCDDEAMPLWLRVVFSAVLAVLGAVGVWMLTSNKSTSYFLDTICFTEVALCLITCVGINTSVLSERKHKVTIIRTALWFVFVFYCLYMADMLFLNRIIETKFVIADFAEYSRTHISFDLFGDMAKTSVWSIAECAFYVMPYAFCVPVLMKSYRNIIVYFLYMTLSFFAVSTLRIITMTGSASLAQCVACLIGAAVAYLIFMLPPVQGLLRNVGLLEWVKFDDEED